MEVKVQHICECGNAMERKIGETQFTYHSLKWSRDYSAQKSYGGKK